MWIPTVKALKKRFEIYRDAKSESENRDVPLGEGVSLVRDMFVAPFSKLNFCQLNPQLY